MIREHTLRAVCWQCIVAATVICAFPKRIPIGAVFERSSHQSTMAFRYAVNRHNKNTSTTLVKLNPYEEVVDSGDSYTLQKAVCSILAKGAFSLFADVNDASLAMMKAYSRTLHVPIVVPGQSVNASLVPDAFTLNMRPLYHRAIIDILKYYHWRTAFYVYDTDEGLCRLQQLFSALQAHGSDHIEIEVVRLTNVPDSYAQLRRIDEHGGPEDDVYVILDLNGQQSLQTVLAQIQNMGMNRANYHYLLGGLIMDELNLEDFKYGGVNITGFRLIDPQRKEVKARQKGWAKMQPDNWKGTNTSQTIELNTALTIDALSVTAKGLKKLLHNNHAVIKQIFRHGKVYNHDKEGIQCDISEPVPWVLGDKIIRAFRKVSFQGITGWVQFDKRGQRTNYTLDVLELNLDTKPRRIGRWRSASGLEMEKRLIHGTNKEQRRNRTRIVTSIDIDPYLMLKKTTPGGKPLVGNDRYKGYSVDLAKKVAEVVGFDYIIRLVKDRKYGKRVNGTWNGIVGELLQNEADLAIAPLTITADRAEVIDFSKPFMSLGISIMIKKPEKQKPGVFSFMDPLSYKIWLYVILAYIGVSLVLFLVSRFSPYEWQIEDSAAGPTFTNDFTVMNSLWFALGAIMRQGCDISPRSLSGRMVGAVWWFCTLILISSYTANLAAFLTVERMLTPIESADDLAKQTVIQYGALSSGSTQEFFRSSEIDVYKQMWNFMRDTKPSVFVNFTTEGVRRVRNSKSKYAFLLESTMNDYFNQRKPCNTMKVGGNLDSKGYGIATPIGSDLREDISLAVLQMRESGYLAKLHKKWWYDKGECPVENEGGSKQSALTLSNVAGVFYILIGGLGLSMLTSLLEFLYKSRRESKRQKKRFGTSKPIAPKAIMPCRDSQDGENGRTMATSASQSTVPIARSSAISLV